MVLFFKPWHEAHGHNEKYPEGSNQKFPDLGPRRILDDTCLRDVQCRTRIVIAPILERANRQKVSMKKKGKRRAEGSDASDILILDPNGSKRCLNECKQGNCAGYLHVCLSGCLTK